MEWTSSTSSKQTSTFHPNQFINEGEVIWLHFTGEHLHRGPVLTPLNTIFVGFSSCKKCCLLITATVNISWAGKQNLQRLTESLVGLPPTYFNLLINYVWIQVRLFHFIWTKAAFHILSPVPSPTWAHVKLKAETETLFKLRVLIFFLCCCLLAVVFQPQPSR